MNRIISNITDDHERAFYGSQHKEFININIDGPLDGESAFKECKNIRVDNSFFNLRYPFWHNDTLFVANCKFTENCRAAFWYDNNVIIEHSESQGIKSFRECKNVFIKDCSFHSDEIFWRCKDIEMNDSSIESVYGFFESKNVSLCNVKFKGKYSFQYIENLTIKNSRLDTKDAFWHTKNAVIENCIIIGEYLGWYSENLTLRNCHIKGTQPLCYCKNLQLINCTFEDADLAFEYSEVSGSITGTITSIKNPLSGSLLIDELPKVIVDENDRSNGAFSLFGNK